MRLLYVSRVRDAVLPADSGRRRSECTHPDRRDCTPQEPTHARGMAATVPVSRRRSGGPPAPTTRWPDAELHYQLQKQSSFRDAVEVNCARVRSFPANRGGLELRSRSLRQLVDCLAEYAQSAQFMSRGLQRFPPSTVPVASWASTWRGRAHPTISAGSYPIWMASTGRHVSSVARTRQGGGPP